MDLNLSLTIDNMHLRRDHLIFRMPITIIDEEDYWWKVDDLF